MLNSVIRFRDLMFACMDISGNDSVSVIIDGSVPDKMLAKSAIAIYGNYFVVWFTGTMFGLSEKSDLEL